MVCRGLFLFFGVIQEKCSCNFLILFCISMSLSMNLNCPSEFHDLKPLGQSITRNKIVQNVESPRVV